MKNTITLLLILLHFVGFSQIYTNVVIHHSDCHSACDGSVAVAGQGGVAPYTYTWVPSGVNTSTINNLCPGQYTVLVTDAALNTNSTIVTILEQPSYFPVSFTHQQTCFGACSGSITVLPTSGATPPYTYSINNVPATPWVPTGNLCEGSCTVSVTDATNCSSNYVFYLNSYPSMTYSTIITSTNSACGACSGAANIYPPSYSSSSYSYNCVWNPGGMTNDTVANICPGNYSVNITDHYGCSFTKTVSILSTGNSIPNFTANTTSYNETCYLSNDGAINLSLTGANPGPFTYQWSNGNTTQDLTNISSGIYAVTIYDGSSNCNILYDTITSIGTNCGTIYGKAFIDYNVDCNRNLGDFDYNGATVIINPGNRLGYTNSLGNYIINNLPYGTYSISINPNNSSLTSSCTSSLNTTINSFNPNSINNIPLDINALTQTDIQVSAYSYGIVPGYYCQIYYHIQNLSLVNTNGIFKATLPPSFIPNITSPSPTTYTLSGDTILWNFNNISYSNDTSFFIEFIPPIGTTLGSIFTTCMWANTTVADYNPSNNTYCYNRLVTGSFDPNDKSVSPSGTSPNGNIMANETELTYLIRFQNTGNGPAVNIVVKDSISSNLDISTFQILNASHAYAVDILPGNVLRWKFDNIMLIDSNANEPASHGFIQYRIKQKANNPIGTQIKNTAYIYFDFNDPVITNTTLNTLASPTSVLDISKNESDWLVYPNPSNGTLYLINNNTSSLEESQIQIVNAMGQVVHTETTTSNRKAIDLTKLNNGVYFVKISSDIHNSVKRIVLSK